MKYENRNLKHIWLQSSFLAVPVSWLKWVQRSGSVMLVPLSSFILVSSFFKAWPLLGKFVELTFSFSLQLEILLAPLSLSWCMFAFSVKAWSGLFLSSWEFFSTVPACFGPKTLSSFGIHIFFLWQNFGVILIFYKPSVTLKLSVVYGLHHQNSLCPFSSSWPQGCVLAKSTPLSQRG